MDNIEQRTDLWFRQRLGKITASEIYVLMKDRKEPMTEEELAIWKEANPKSRVTTKTVPFSDATFTYLNKKIMECYLPINSKSFEAVNAVENYIQDHSFTTKAMDFGVLYEDVAKNAYKEAVGRDVTDTGFIPYEKFPYFVGGSPDGLVDDGEGGIEVKCPFTLEKHMQHMLYDSPNDLKENDEQYYWQCVACMLFTGRKYWDFVSFNPYVSKNISLKILRIPRNDEEIKMLDDRIALAVEYYREQFDKISNIKNKVLTYE